MVKIKLLVVWCYPTPSEDGGEEEFRGGPPNSLATPQGLDQRSKMEELQRWLAGEAQMRDNPEGGEVNPAVDAE